MKRAKNFNMYEMRNLRNIVYEKTGYHIKNQSLLVQAFTHSSYSAQFGGENNEVLKFIGERVLNYFAVKIIAERYGCIKIQRNYSFDGDCEYVFREHMRDFSELKKKIINNVSLARKVDEWDLMQYIIVGKCDVNSQAEGQEKVKSDIFQAILGAVAAASQWNAKVLQRAVEQTLQIREYLMEMDRHQYRPEYLSAENAVNILKKLAEQGQCSEPTYEYASPKESRYDENGNPQWVCTCRVSEWGMVRQVWASSKKLARKYAAYLILCEHFELYNEYGRNKAVSIWKYEDGTLNPIYGETITNLGVHELK